jgi:hypothetical protein
MGNRLVRFGKSDASHLQLFLKTSAKVLDPSYSDLATRHTSISKEGMIGAAAYKGMHSDLQPP